MNIFIVNCGSSSLKYQVINAETGEVLAKGLCERIGIDGALTYQKAGGEKEKSNPPMPTHKEAIRYVLEALTNEKTGALKTLSDIDAVGHRIVHGGEKFTKSAVIDDEMIKAVEECNELAPLHNPANIIGINACRELMPGVPMVGVFDTAFHQTMPPKAYMYAIPYKYYENYKIRRYGFHGTSHSFVAKRLCEITGKDINNSKIIVCHLGNGASVTAILNGKSVDTSMGLTPLEGLVMGTRSGDIDPGALEFIAHKENLTLDQLLNILNKESGVYGISCGKSDFRDLDIGAKDGDNKCALAVDMFAYRVAKYVGSYVAAMNGVDYIAFTAGIGENDDVVREKICEYFGYLGIDINKEANSTRGEEIMLSTANSKVGVYIIPTNEELAIARETVALIKK